MIIKATTSGGISADFGIPGESIACFPSVTTSFTSSPFVFLPRVPNLFQNVSPCPEAGPPLDPLPPVIDVSP